MNEHIWSVKAKHLNPHTYLETLGHAHYRLRYSCKFYYLQRGQNKDQSGDKANGTFSLYVLAGTCNDDSRAEREGGLLLPWEASVQQISTLFIQHHVKIMVY